MSNHSVRRIKKLKEISKACSYLEVGVFKGLTFLDLSFDRKVGVDPKFQFDYQSHSKKGVSFYEIFSDDYFAGKDNGGQFDIVFLDGLHTYQQTLRDLMNALSFCHDRSFVVIDDVFPNDVFSAIPSMDECYKYRRKHDKEKFTYHWHGDVYKVVFFLHDFMSSYDYVSIESNGNHQAVLWRKPRAKFTPLFNSLEAISRLSYIDMLENKSVFNFKEEDEAFEYIKNSFG